MAERSGPRGFQAARHAGSAITTHGHSFEKNPSEICNASAFEMGCVSRYRRIPQCQVASVVYSGAIGVRVFGTGWNAAITNGHATELHDGIAGDVEDATKGF